MCCVCESYKGVVLCLSCCDLASTLCKYDLKNCDLFVLRWARVRRLRRKSISSMLLMWRWAQYFVIASCG